MKSALLLCTALATFACSSAFAQSQQTNEQIETVIVTGNRPPLNMIPMKAPYTESTITPEAILNASPSPANTVQTLLNTQPSIYATVGSTNGMETDIKFRSFADGEFGETFAGVPLNDIFNGGVTYQADNRNNVLLSVRDLDSVDIYRGVNNPAVNTYNSLGGTINFVPRQPADDFGGSVGVDGGSFDTLGVHGQIDTGDWNGIKQTLSVERTTSEGWLQHSPDWSNNIYYAGNAELPYKTELFSYFVYNKNEGDAPQYIPLNLLNSKGQDFQWPTNIYKAANNDQNFMGIFGGKSEITDWLKVEDEAYIGNNNYQRVSFSNANNYLNQYFIDDQGTFSTYWQQAQGGWMSYDPVTLFGSTVAGTNYHFYGYNGTIYGDRIQVTADLPHNTITTGGDFNLGELHSREYWYGAGDMPKIIGYNDAWDELDTRLMWSGYIQDDIHFLDDSLHITPGLKYIDSTIKDNDAIGIFYFPPGSIKGHEHFLSPTVGVNYQFTDEFTMYGSFGRNVKFPDITALYNELGYNGAVPPVTVQPEYVLDYELGARYKEGSLTTELNVYWEDFSHVIFTYPVLNGGGASAQANGGGQQYRGIELQFTDDFGEIWLGDWKGYLNASYNEAQCTTEFKNSGADTGAQCNVGQSLNNVPQYLMNVGLIWDYDNWHVDLQGHYVGLQQLLDYNTGQPDNGNDIMPGQLTKIPDYFLVNVGVVKVIPIEWGPANALRLAVHVDNLFDKRYYSSGETNTDTANPGNLLDFYGLTGESRAVFGSVSIYF